MAAGLSSDRVCQSDGLWNTASENDWEWRMAALQIPLAISDWEYRAHTSTPRSGRRAEQAKLTDVGGRRSETL